MERVCCRWCGNVVRRKPIIGFGTCVCRPKSGPKSTRSIYRKKPLWLCVRLLGSAETHDGREHDGAV